MSKSRFGKENIKYVCDSYHSKTSKELARELDVSHQWVLKQWMIAGLKGKKKMLYHHDDEYFSIINTSNKAYVLGFIASDGCIYRRKDSPTKQGWISIAIHRDDTELLEAIALDMKCNKPIMKTKTKTTEVATLSVVSDNLLSQLERIGIGQRKTWSMSIEFIMSNIPKEFHSDFIRGYFDGDGSIYIPKANPTPSICNITISIPKSGGDFLSSYVNKEIGAKTSFVNDTRSYNGDFGSLSIGNIRDKYFFIKYLYKNVEDNKSTLFMKRKLDNCYVYLNLVESNISNRIENKKTVQLYNLAQREA